MAQKGNGSQNRIAVLWALIINQPKAYFTNRQVEIIKKFLERL
jgi:hypothetical protein